MYIWYRVWYAFGYLIACFFVFFGLSTLFVVYLRNEKAPPAPEYEHTSSVIDDRVMSERRFELPFDPISFAFTGVSYAVKTPDGEELRLLHEVTGFFEPGVVTALMGSSGAGRNELISQFLIIDLLTVLCCLIIL